jgi:tRNA threonylcarbamoyladenosine dehydratase
MTTDTTSVGFYEELTLRNRGFISHPEQSALSNCSVLVAGCGSTGGAVVEPLIRLGVSRLILADPGEYEVSNLNRQDAIVSDVGRNKATVAAGRANAINPYSSVEVETIGICQSNVSRLVARATVVVDGVDVTEEDGLAAKYLLHAEAVAQGKPVISGYDMAGAQYIRFYDYRRRGARPFDGRITLVDLAEGSSPLSVLARLIPLRYVPTEMFEALRANADDPGYSIPQLAYTAKLFGVLASRMVVELVAGRRVRRETVVDVHHIVRPWQARVVDPIRRISTLVVIVPNLIRMRRSS